MQNSRYRQLDLSEEVTEFFDDFELEKISNGLSLLEYFQLKGILFDPTKIEDSQDKIEELRVTGNPTATLISSIVSSVFFIALGIVGLILIPNEELGEATFFFFLVIVIPTLFFSIRSFLTNVIVYSDRLMFRKPIGGSTIYWHAINRVTVRDKKGTETYRNFIGLKKLREVKIGLILDVFLNGGRKISLDLEAYGLESGPAIVKKIFDYMLHFNPKIKLPGRSPEKLFNQATTDAFAQLTSNPSLAFKLAIDLLILDDTNPHSWKLIALLIVSIIPEESFPFVETALAYTPNDADLWNAKGLAYEQLEGNDLALEAYSKALSIDSKHTFAHNNFVRLSGKEPISPDQTIQFSLPNSIVQSESDSPKIASSIKESPAHEIKVKIKDIKQLEKIIAKQTTVSVGHLMTITGMFKSKIIKIATEHLDFVLNDDILVKDVEAPTKDHLMKIERIKHLIGNKEEASLSYLETVTKLPLDEIIAIVKNDLGFKILDDKVIQ